MEEKFDCVVVANGEFPTKKQALDYLSEARMIICCDGAVEHLLKYGIEPHYIVGDCDSISVELQQRFADRIIHISEQESNDLTKCMRFAVSKEAKRVVILAATGKREDHTLGNISLLTVYRTMFDRVMMVSDYGEFTSIYQTTTFQSFPGQQVSLIAIPPIPPVTLHGLVYPLNHYKMQVWWEGTLNQAISDSFTIELAEEGNVLVYLLHKDE